MTLALFGGHPENESNWERRSQLPQTPAAQGFHAKASIFG
jgi:hypothetical protein